MNCTSPYASSLSTFPSNTDITGVGNRSALYASAFLGWFLALFFPDDLSAYRDAARTAFVTSTSLIVAGLYAMCSPQLGLTLVDAQIITMLVLLISVCHYRAITADKADFGRTTRWAALSHGILSGAFGIIVYAKVDTFGGAAYIPECPNEQYIFVLFGSMSATNGGLRVFSLLVFSLQILLIVSRNRRDWIMGCMKLLTGGGIGGVRHAGERTKVVATIWALLLMIYFVATIETMISRNGLDTTANLSQWSFGQILAMVLLLDQLLKAGTRFRTRMLLGAPLKQTRSAST